MPAPLYTVAQAQSALRLLNLGEMPQQLALMVAGWIACVAPPEGFDPGPIAAAMIEPAKEKLAAVTTLLFH